MRDDVLLGRRLESDDEKEYWRFVEATSREVASWPNWKKGSWNGFGAGVESVPASREFDEKKEDDRE